MDVMRINCAHDDAVAWHGMVENLHRAEKEVGRRCRVLMDLAGPKLRTGQIAQVNHILRWKPARDAAGTVIAPAKIWLSSTERPEAPSDEYVVLPVSEDLAKHSKKGDVVLIKDARRKTRKISVVRRGKDGIAAESVQSAYVE